MHSYRSSANRFNRRKLNRATAAVQLLESRRLLSATISGKILQDISGNGSSADDTAMAGVQVSLFRDVNKNGSLDAGDGAAIATATSAAETGAYSFGGLAAARYFVKETSPSNSVRTLPTTTDKYTVNATGNNTYSNNTFDNFIKSFNKGTVTGLSYTVNGKKVTSLNNVQNGDTVTVSFTLSTAVTMSLVDYDVPSLPPVNLLAQKVDAFSTQNFTAGKHSLTIKVEDCGLFQIDLVGGKVIDHFGPSGSNISYSTQARLIANGAGGQICIPGELCGFVFVDTDHSCLKFPDEQGINNVLITLTGTTHSGESVSETTHTDSNGFYCFTDLDEGTYKVVETQPSGFVHEGQMAGTFGGIDTVSHIISVIPLPNGGDGENYNFCETVPPPPPPPPHPGIGIVKLTNGANDPDPNGSNVPVLAPGAAVTWSYLVTNTGNVPFPKSTVEVTDNQPGVTPTPKLSGGFVVGDANDNNILDPGETWTYQAMGTAVNLNNPPAGVITVPLGAGFIDSTLGAAADYTALALASTRVQLSSGPLNFTGNVGVGNSGKLEFSAGTVNGHIDVGTGAKNAISGGASASGGVVSRDMTQITNAAVAASNTFAGLTPTHTINGDVTSSTTFTGNGGLNVIKINGMVHLSGGALTLTGGANDQFVVNITGGFQLDGGANVVLSGVNPNQVVFNFLGGNGYQVQTSGKAQTEGIFLAPNEAIQVNGGIHNSEFISGVNLSFQSNPVVFQPPPPPVAYENTGTVTIDNTDLIASYISNYRNPVAT